MHDTAAPSKLVPTFLVFESMSRLHLPTIDLLGQKERMKAMMNARKEMTFLSNHSKLRTVLHANVSIAAGRLIFIGHEVLMLC